MLCAVLVSLGNSKNQHYLMPITFPILLKLIFRMQRAIVGKHAPKFQLESVFEEDFGDVGLESYLGKYVVLLFYVRDL